MMIATHDGATFHGDEVFAVAILLRKYPDAVVIRTRNPKLLIKADIRVDVGGRHLPYTDADHHQPDFDWRRETNGIPYASCGIVAEWFKNDPQVFPSPEVFYKLDRALFSVIDAYDNAIEVSKSLHKGISSYDLPKIIASYRPPARSTRNKDSEEIAQLYYDAFMRAVHWAGGLIQREIDRTYAWIEDQDLVNFAIARGGYNPILVLPAFAPWQERVILDAPYIQVVVFPDEHSRQWVAQTVPNHIGHPSPPLFPREWAGKRDEALEQTSGVEGAAFCHSGLFLAVAKTKEAALQLAEFAISD